MLYSILLFAGIMSLVYFLYINGFGGVSNKSALMYIGSISGARFASCTGTIKRVLKFKESRVVCFTLDLNLSKGKLIVELLDKDKCPVLTLSDSNSVGRIDVTAKQRYYLVFKYQSATGDYSLRWE